MDSSPPMAEWLATLGLAHYAEAFAAHRITFDVLTELRNHDFLEMGTVAIGDRKRLLSAITKMCARRDGLPCAEPAPLPGIELRCRSFCRHAVGDEIGDDVRPVRYKPRQYIIQRPFLSANQPHLILRMGSKTADQLFDLASTHDC